MGPKVEGEAPLVSTILELSSTFRRLKMDHSYEEALLLATTVAISIYGAPEDLPPASSKETAAPPPKPNQSHLSKSARKRLRQSPQARARADAKRAAFLRAKADGLAPNADHESDTSPNNEANAPSTKNSPSPPLSPPMQQASKTELQSTDVPMLPQSGLGKRNLSDRSPSKHLANPDNAHLDNKRAYGSPPKQLVYDSSVLSVGHVVTPTENLEHSQPSSDSTRASIIAFVEANRAWKGLAGPGYSQVFEKVISTLSQELADVDKVNWGKHVHERLGKVAGYECKKANVWIA